MKTTTATANALMRLLCAVALLSLSFAHRPPQVVAAVFETASLMLPDGSFADICVDDHHVKHPSAVELCEACLLAGSTLLPVRDDSSYLIAHFASLDNADVSAERAAEAQSIARPRSRGPPVAS